MQPTKPRTILVVEDDPLLSKMYEAKLTNGGFVVIKAADGEEGLKTAITTHPDFILLDVMMPRLSGLDMLAALRKDTWGATVPVIVLSNLSENQEGDKAKALGVKEYLIKANFTPSEILEKIKAYLT